MPSPQTSSASTADDPKPEVAASQTVANPWQSGPLAGIGVGLLAGLCVWILVEMVHPVFWTDEGRDEWGFLPVEVQRRLDISNAVFVMALLGGMVGAAVAVGEGFCRRSWKTTLIAGVGCVVLGILFGGLSGLLGHMIFEMLKLKHDLSDLQKSMGIYVPMFAVTGAGVGLGAGLFLGRRIAAKCLIAGGLAGLLAALTYPIIVAALMPNALTSVLIPVQPMDRLLWFGLSATLLGLILPSVARSRQKPPPQL